MKTKLGASFAVVFSLLCGCGGAQTVSGTMGSSGGSLSLGSALTLTVPAGAVDDGTVITVREVEPRHGDREFELEPRGLELRLPAEVSLEADRAMRVTWRENEVEHGLELERFDDRRMRGQVHRLGHLVMRHHSDAGTPGAGGSGTACVDDDVCACGSECVLGRCTAVVTCTSNAQCSAGERCRVAEKHGQACGVNACHP